MASFDTVANVISDAGKGLGVISSALADPYASTDPNVVQLCTLLTELGQDLVRQHQWSHLRVEYTFVTVNGTAAYSLPTDYDRLTDQSQWDRTQQWPMAGPLSAQGWQAVQAQSLGGTVDAFFRVWSNQLHIYPTPGATVRTIAYEYISKYWVAVTAAPTTRSKETPSIASDVLHFDRMVLIYGLRLAFLEAKGFPTGAVQRKYDDALAAAKGEGAAPVLSLNQRPIGTHRYLDGHNVPDTDFGA